MKKYIFIFLLCTSELFATSFETEVSLFGELTSAYNSKFYPGAVQYAERIEENFPDSALLGETLLIKGESLVKLNFYNEACYTLLNAKKYTETNEVLLNKCNYWLARVYDFIGNYPVALEFYYEYCENAVAKGFLTSGKITESSKYYPEAILNSARLNYRNKNFIEAISLFEYVIQNGNNFSKEDYADALLKLMDSYNNSKLSNKSINLYKKFNQESFNSINLSPFIFYLFIQYAGDAYLNLGEYKKAYDIYCIVLKSGEKSLASNALKKAYNVSVEHKTQVGTEPGDVLADAQKFLSDSPDILGEFWTRLGADAYSSGDYKKALYYFDEAEKNASIDLFLFAALYRAQIAAGKDPSVKSAFIAEDMINKSRNILNEENKNILYRESNILLTKYAAIQGKWEDVINYGKNVMPLDSDTRYYLALANYYLQNYLQANSYLNGDYNNLHALTYAQMQDLKNAAIVYSEIEKNRPLSDEERLNYAKVLLYSGRYKESQIEAAKCTLNEAKYILGLSQFNTWSWPYAEDSFKDYLKSKLSDNDRIDSYALFYLGYSQYRQGKTKDSYNNLSSFVKKYPSHELYWNALITTANSAVQNNKNENAIEYAEMAIKNSLNDRNREESVLLCAEIYIDSNLYDKALNLLIPYSKFDNNFGIRCMYKIGQIYEKQHDFEKADLEYKEISTKSKDEDIAEEAMYRRGEMYYNNSIYDKAISCFNEYVKKYSIGVFVDASWYYMADSYVNTGNVERAILQNQALIKKFPESPFVYSSCKNLIELYRNKGDYSAAQEYAKFLISKYGDQARNDGISEVVSDLEKLYSGKSEAIVVKENEYKKNGESSTLLGRNIGTGLVYLYAETVSFSRNAVFLAEQLLPIQKKNLSEESLNAAKNASFLGRTYRLGDKNKDAAEMYLLAAEYFRQNSKDEDAAASLYGAYDSFRAAGLRGDADETARTLKSLYPNSRQAKNIKIGTK